MTNPFRQHLEALVRDIPPGRVTTYNALARALDARMTSQDTAALLMDLCQPVAGALFAGGLGDPAALPCWRVLDDGPAYRLRPTMFGETPDSRMYGVTVAPLIAEGLRLSPPDYWCPPEAFYEWNDTSPLHWIRFVDDEGETARDQYFSAKANAPVEEQMARLTQHGPYAIGLPGTFAEIYHMRINEKNHKAVLVDLVWSDQWDGARTVQWVLPKGEEDYDTGPSAPNDRLGALLFDLETQLDDGRFRFWEEDGNGIFVIPPWVDKEERLVLSPLPDDPVQRLDAMRALVTIRGGRIYFFQEPDQWHASPAPASAWDPPAVLGHIGLVRMAPYLVHTVELAPDGTTWRFGIESTHFPELQRTVYIHADGWELDGPLNVVGKVWRQLETGCEAWFDLHYSDQVPEEQRVTLYAYGGWHPGNDGTWTLRPL